MFKYIAESTTGDPKTWNDDITGFLAPSFFPIRWSILQL